MTEYYDDGGFEGYVETSIDPSPYMFIATAVFCVASVAVLPCLVTLGRRYEKRRLNRPAEERPFHGPEERVKEADREEAASSRVFPQAPSSYTRCKSEASADTAMLKTFIDKIIMPPYPDDADGPDVACVSPPNGMSSGRPVRSDDSGYETESSSSSSIGLIGNTTVLDTGGATRRRQAGRRRYFRRFLQQQEWDGRQKVTRQASHGGGALSARSLGRGRSYSEGVMLEGYSERSNDGMSCRSLGLGAIYEGDGAVGISFYSSSQHHDANGASGLSTSARSRLDDPAVLPAVASDTQDARADATLSEKVPMEGDDDVDLCCGDRAWWKPSMIAAGFDRLLEVAEWDKEMRKICSLAIPFSLASVSKGIFDTIRVALVAHYLGTSAVAAYTIVDIILGLCSEFFGGFPLAVTSLSSQAIGAENYELAGEYVQISCIMYSVLMVPNIIVWMLFTADVVKLFGFDDATAQLAQEYARFYVLMDWIEGLDESYGALLECSGHERFSVFMGISAEVVETAVMVVILVTLPSTTLPDIGVLELSMSTFFFVLTLVMTWWFGWMDKYHTGIFRTFALSNTTAMHAVFRMAVPLAFGQLLQYGEWEVLTIFVAAIGPAEVTAWGILGSLWDTLETLTEGFGDAGEIRVAFHLGAGKPAQARMSSYKTILFAVVCSTLFTSIIWMLGEDLAKWLTPDPTLQYLIMELLPLIGIGNITLTGGTVSWALVGAQGRYRLATLTAFVSSWCVTLPLAAIFTYGLNFDLQGITSAVVMGYSVTGTCLMYILLRSDWERLSRLVVELTRSYDSASDAGESPSSSSSEVDETIHV